MLDPSIFAPDNFYALTLKDALPTLRQWLVAYIGFFPIAQAARPQTDGRRIYLKGRINEFVDRKKDTPLEENRNMSLYLTDLIHEMLHIRDGTFLVDGRPYLEGFENQGLAHYLFNIPEDARIEHDAPRIVRPRDVTLLVNSNQYLATVKELGAGKLHDDALNLYSSILICKGLPSHYAQQHARAKNARSNAAMQAKIGLSESEARKWEFIARQMAKESAKMAEAHEKFQEQERETLEAGIEDVGLRSEGLVTVRDVVREMLAVSDAVYGRRVEATWGIVPRLYDIVTRAFPEIEQEHQGNGGMLTPVEAPCGNKGGKGQGQGNGEDEKESEGKGKTQMAYTGFRGDVHDFSNADKKGSTLQELGAIQAPIGKKPKIIIPRPTVGQVGTGDKKEEESTVTEMKIITYDDLLKAYKHIEPLRVVPYEGERPDFLDELSAYDDIRAEIVDHFARQKPNQLQIVRRNTEPGNINIEALIEVLADPSLAHDTGIYDSPRVNRRDSLTYILFDRSGSTTSRVRQGSDRTVLDLEKLSAGLLYQALTDPLVGDRVAVYAFDTTGSGTNLYELTDLENLGAVRAGSGNADGVAIRGLGALMHKRRAKRKTMLVLSDGKPVAGINPNSDPVVDTSMAFMEMNALGIKTAYFNISPERPEYFATLTRNCDFAVWLNQMSHLPAAVGDFALRYL